MSSHVNYIAKWSGSSWSALGLGTGVAFGAGTVYALAASGDDLYVGGDFTQTTNTDGTVVGANYIARWDGTSWSALDAGMSWVVQALAVSGPDLYAGGVFVTAGGSEADRLARWDGNSWSPMGTGMDNIVYALAIAGSDLYAGGSFT